MSSPAVAPLSSVKKENATANREVAVSQSEIANLAYALWQASGCPEGTADENWLAAERQLGSARTSTKA